MNDTVQNASILIGGPFWRWQQRLGLLGPDQLPRVSTALLFAALAWLPPALLSATQGLAFNPALGARSFLLDPGPYARLIVGIAVLVVTERIAEERGNALLRHFTESGVVPPEQSGALAFATQHAQRRSSSTLAEAVILGLAYTISVLSMATAVGELPESWAGHWVAGHFRLSLAGWWVLLVSVPLFWFLALRWFWRFAVVIRLFWDIKNLKLRLVATHPDRSGGIAFVGHYPLIFVGFVFAFSATVASTALRLVLFADWPLQSVAGLFIAAAVVVLVFFVGPLTLFTPTLLRVRRQGALAYGVLASEHHQAFERKWLRREAVGDDSLGAPDISSLADLGTAVRSISDMRVIPANKETFMSLLIAIGLPWIPVLATQIPILELLKMVAKGLLR